MSQASKTWRPAPSCKLIEEGGFAKNGNDLWEKDGATVPAVINGFEGIHGDVVPIIISNCWRPVSTPQ